MTKQTKIVATISNQRCDIDFIRALFNEGMNIVRINSAHMGIEGFNKIIANVRAVSNQIGILIDTKGPEIRTTITKEPIVIKAGDELKVTGNPDLESSKEMIALTYRNLIQDINAGADILIEDGTIELKVISKTEDYLVCEAQNDAELGSRKNVNIPGIHLNLPSLTERDKENILYAIENKVDFIAHSFVRNKQDVMDVQKILDDHKSDIKVIAKIENQDGIDNAEEILEAAYGLMIARGDLGIEIPMEKVPVIQRILIRKCIVAKKPVIVATQMLQSMITNPRPTRAEVTDIADAIFNRTDAMMLSGETAAGKYPVEAVRTMVKIAEEAEKNKQKEDDIKVPLDRKENDITSFLAKQAVKSVEYLDTKAIITESFTGKTARNLAAYRGVCPVLAICYRESLIRQLALSYGVTPLYQEKGKDPHSLEEALKKLIKEGYLHNDDKIAYLGGGQGVEKGITFLEIDRVDDIMGQKKK
jgi:pyruvate kinase